MATGAPKAQRKRVFPKKKLSVLSAVRRFEDPVNSRNKGNFKTAS